MSSAERAQRGQRSGADLMLRMDATDDRVAAIAGVVHGGYGALVEVVADALDEGLWKQARVMTAAQLERTLPAYRFDDEPEPEPGQVDLDDGTRPSDGPEADEVDVELNDDGDTRAEGDVGDAAADGLGAGHDRGGFGGFGPGPEEKRRASWSWDDQGMGRLSACLPTDEALVFEAAWQAARADLLAQRRGELPDGAVVPWISGPDVLLHLARTYLDHGRERRPGADRYLVHTHLDHHPDGQPVLHRHLGPVLPDALRRYLGCDADARPVWAVEGVAVSVGRRERLVPDRTRRLVEQRDGGCIVPGCDRRWGLDVHHITHWEDLGRTDTDNLCCLCRTHHRQHHVGLLDIAGNADEPGGLRVTDRWGRAMEPAAAPTRSTPNGRSSAPPTNGARRAITTSRPPVNASTAGRSTSNDDPATPIGGPTLPRLRCSAPLAIREATTCPPSSPLRGQP